ncbi:phospho-N-acetylmuramoyl-pentapeptide-transferase [Ornithinicoccus hortensis]|uniref:Phospho-N-acetylmuramoyl-pentapeptide-transferase n=1 Tax=Ornithinicoccus hortensis TaxID=82346 RepID=A0A542YR15_9MICO|nr:phospho-N-acetylmuramoyl-pentapeptide-transferase [Ornithinicoccus hortensis]TQL50535.1 phospho-N-acetylmuramoyl-pentapeptide-transferase [Ornithinicoccus hortensis]
MVTVLLSAGIAMVVALFGTPLFIKFLVRRGYGQFIRDDGPTSHHTKRGTPTMGGAVIIAATLLGYFGSHLLLMLLDATGLVELGSNTFTISALLVLFLMAGLGLVGFLDDYIKISKQRSLGLRSHEKLIGQTAVAVIFAVLALQFPGDTYRTPASTAISFVRDTNIDFAVFGTVGGLICFVLWANVMIAGASNGVNLTDGLDGLATGASVMVFGAYVLIGIWQFNQNCQINPGSRCYDVRDAHDLAVVAACVAGACFGFLWWNASPAKIFMGDTGSLALGGALAGLAITTHTQLLMAILGGLFVMITLSVIIQVGYFKMTRKRVFRMAPLQHHFELVGWHEITIVIRFWIIAGLCVAVGLGIFYAEWVVQL